MPRRRTIRRALVIVIACVLCSAACSAAELFHFRNGFWINLHHYLYAQALAGSGAKGRTNTSARDAIQHAPCKAAEDSTDFQAAVAFYAAHYASADWLFDPEMRRLNDLLGDAGDAPQPPAGLPADLAEQLRNAAPAYRAACWPAHQRANEEWIAALQPRVAKHGQAIATRLGDIYESRWPAPVVDVVTYANWAGAYTYDKHITVASVNPDYQGDSALEMIFHESSHALGDRLFDQLRAHFARHHSEMPRNFDHALIFFTAGIVTKLELKTVDPDYVPYADRLGIFRRVPQWAEDEAAFAKYWEPYLEGKVSRESALGGLAQAICCEDSGNKAGK